MGNSVLLPLCASVLAFSLPTALHGQDGSLELDGRREAIALFQGVAANWQHLENYDVMVIEKHHQPGDAPEWDAIVSRVRMIANHDGNRYLFVGAGSNENSQERRLAAFYLDGESGECWIRRSLNEPAIKLSTQATRNLGLALSRFPDVRFVGARAYPARFLETPIDEYFATDFGFANDVRIEAIGDDNREVVETILPGKNSRFQRRYTFAREKPVPTHLIFLSSARDGTRQWVTNDESISWKEINGVFLPSEIQGISRTHREAEPKHFSVTFNWLVVSDATRLPPFSADVLSDDQKLWGFLQEN